MKLGPIMPGLAVLILYVIVVVCGSMLIMDALGWPWWPALPASVPMIHVDVYMLYLVAFVLVTGGVEMIRRGLALRTRVRRELWPPFDDDFFDDLGGLGARVPRRSSPGGLDATMVLPFESDSPATAVNVRDRQQQANKTNPQRLTMLGRSAPP